MKKVVMMLISVAFSLIVASVCSAQTEGTAGSKAMMSHDHQVSDLSSLMTDMSDMISKMAGMLKTANPAQMKTLSGMLKDLSKEMINMSHLMDGNMISDRQFEMMRVRLMKTQRKMAEIETKK